MSQSFEEGRLVALLLEQEADFAILIYIFFKETDESVKLTS